MPPRLSSLLRLFRREPFYPAASLLLTLALGLVLFYNFDFGRPTYTPGAIASETIKSPRATTYRSEIKTKEARDRASSAVEPVYLSRSIFEREQDSRLSGWISAVEGIRSSASAEAEKLRQLKAAGSLSLSDTALD